MKSVLVTGASGFVGSHLVPVLKQRGYTVLGTYLHENEPRDPAADWVQWALDDEAAFTRILTAARPTQIIHLASPSHVPTAEENPEATVDAILKASIHFCRAVAAATHVERVLYVSSAEVYGKPPDESRAVSEDHVATPRSAYGICKLAAGYWFQHALRERVVVLRPFNQIGPRQSPRFAVASFASQLADIKAGRRPPQLMTGNLDVVRDWTDVRESATAHVEALERGVAGEVYNLCSGRGVSLRTLVEAMAATTGIDIEIKTDPARVRAGETMRFVGDGTKLTKATGWRAERPARDAAVAALEHAMSTAAA